MPPLVATLAPKRSPERPPLRVHLTAHGLPEGAQLEFTARPGTLLGGPFSVRPTRKKDVQLFTEAEIGDAHLKYLRQAYRAHAETRLLLDQMAGQFHHGRNRMVIIADVTAVGQNIMRAVEGLAGRLPAVEED
ncbi:hypothetical protein [Deinococcus ruber]|uniref:Uncharacterized protein n=1 Tax=Deinococcus ruber TaxID=1848197 RepID=A0A918F9K8_9DEIO|nr:hypothetical protein [Deinococcus ruber]GGR13454.1 hypothetical protein GCM10008957_28010 [Deinococcus ruber]